VEIRKSGIGHTEATRLRSVDHVCFERPCQIELRLPPPVPDFLISTFSGSDQMISFSGSDFRVPEFEISLENKSREDP
jgi:hypothetical protein